MTNEHRQAEIRTFRAQDGCKIAYRLWATEVSGSPSVAIIHGMGLHSGRYVGLATKLRAAGYDVFALDLRGHGLSEGSLADVRCGLSILA